jgi:two-component system, response regulator
MNRYQHVEILYAEDNPADAELTLRTLKAKHIANNVVWVKDGAEALDFLYRRGSYTVRAESAPKLILLDIKMPKVDGIEVLKELKSNEHLKTIPVVIMTSSEEEADLIDSYQLGVNSYVVKPMDFDKFAEMVEEVGLYWLVSNKTLG